MKMKKVTMKIENKRNVSNSSDKNQFLSEKELVKSLIRYVYFQYSLCFFSFSQTIYFKFIAKVMEGMEKFLSLTVSPM